jgi:hypothetical protein
LNVRRWHRRRDAIAATTQGDMRQPCELVVSTSRGGRRLQLFKLTSASTCSHRLPACFPGKFFQFTCQDQARQTRTTERTPTRRACSVASWCMCCVATTPPANRPDTTVCDNANGHATTHVIHLRVPHHHVDRSRRSAMTTVHRISYTWERFRTCSKQDLLDSQKIACFRMRVSTLSVMDLQSAMLHFTSLPGLLRVTPRIFEFSCV